MTIKKILFFKLGALGDVLMSTPLIRQVRKNYPDAEIDFLVGKSAVQSINGNIYLNKILTFNHKIFIKKKIPELIGLIKKIRKQKYDLIFVLDKHWAFNLTAYLFGIKTRIGFNRGKEGIFLTKKIKYGKLRHEINYYLDLGKIVNLNIDYKDNKIDIFPNLKEIKYSKKLIKKYKLKDFYILINGGGNNPAVNEQIRKIPENIFIELVKKISKTNQIIFLASPNEKEYYNLFIFNKNCINLAGKTNIKETYLLMKQAKIIITTDCGPMHMASAATNKIISIFGPTNPKRKAPLNKKVINIWQEEDKKNYQESYEIYGKLPNGRFFKTLKKEDEIKK